jgi:prophage regulatory protein
MNLLKIREVEAKTGLDHVTIWRLEREGLFPRRRTITCRAVRWVEAEIDQWIKELPPAKLLEVAAV